MDRGCSSSIWAIKNCYDLHLDFTILFILECDASDTGIGAVLQQEVQPIKYFNRPLAFRYKSPSAYEMKLIALDKVVRHWRAYLWGHHFLIQTDHYSLKFLLEQRIITSPQQHWLNKPMGFHFAVEYHAGKQNKVADILSRRLKDQPNLASLSMPHLLFFIPFAHRFKIQTNCNYWSKIYSNAKLLGPRITRMTCFFLSDEFICYTILLLFHPLSRLSTIVAMRDIIKHFIVSPRISFGKEWRLLSKLLCGGVLSAKNTRLNTCILQGFSNLCQFHFRYGRISLWISLRDYLRLKGSLFCWLW